MLVVGGGTAGIVAALAAARCGAKTVLVERYGYLGGFSYKWCYDSARLFQYEQNCAGCRKGTGCKGNSAGVVDRMVKPGGALGNAEQEVGGSQYDPFITCIDHEMFKHVAFTMMEEAGVKLYMHTVITDAVTEGCILFINANQQKQRIR